MTGASLFANGEAASRRFSVEKKRRDAAAIFS
jgi:hypothetical protein